MYFYDGRDTWYIDEQKDLYLIEADENIIHGRSISELVAKGIKISEVHPQTKGKLNEDKAALTFYANMTNLVTHQEKDMVLQYIPLDINNFEELQSYLNKVDE